MKFQAEQFARVMPLLAPATYAAAAAANSTAVDCQGYEEALICLQCGTFSATGDVSFIIQESADNVTFAAVSGATIAEKALADGEEIFVGRLNLVGRQRYIRVEYDVDDANVLISLFIVLLHPKYAPATQQNTVEFSV